MLYLKFKKISSNSKPKTKKVPGRHMGTLHYRQESECYLLKKKRATHEIVELVKYNKKEVSSLEQKILIQKTNLETLEISRENMQNFIGENVVQIESSQGVTKALNYYYVKFISEAQMIYDYALKSYRGVEYEEENLEKLSELDKKNKEKYTILTEMYNNQEQYLIKQLEDATINNCKQEEERKNIITENFKLKQELSEIEKEIFVFEEEKSALDKETTQYNNVDDVYHLKEGILKADNEILDLTKKLKVGEEEKQKKEDMILKTLEESNEKLNELENILIEKTAEHQNVLTENEEMKNEITKLKCLNKEAEKQIETFIFQLKKLKKNNEEYEHNFNVEIKNYKDNVCKNEFYLISEKEICEKLTTDEETLKLNLKSAEADVETLKSIKHELEQEPKQDAENELKVKEKIAKKLILKHGILKDEYKRRLTEKREEIENEIVEIEIDNTKTESNIKLMEDEIREIKEKKMEEINKKKLELEKILQGLIKEARICKVVAPVVPQKGTRNWDSDTTMEDEDTSYADKVMMKVKMMNNKK